MKSAILKIVCFFLCIGMCFPLLSPTVAHAEPAKTIVRVGFYDLPGSQSVDDEGNYAGYCYDYLVEIAGYANWDLQFVETDFETCGLMLQHGEIDLIAGMFKTPEREALYDYSAFSIGVGNTTLTARVDNDALSYKSPAQYDGISIGLASDPIREESLASYAKATGFSYKPVHYPDAESLYRALETGEVDAIVASDSVISDQEKLLDRFGFQDYYIALKKGNSNLLFALDQAMAQIELITPTFRTDLYAKYFLTGSGADAAIPVELTQKELDFIGKSGVLRVACTQYMDINRESTITGCFSEMIFHIFDKIQTRTGLQFRYIKADSLEEAMKMVRNGEADLIGLYPDSVSYALKNGFRLTNPYMENNFDLVFNKSYTPNLEKSPRFALVYLVHLNNFILREYPNAEIRYYPSYEDAFAAVNRGSADATFANIYLTEELLARSEMGNLFSQNVTEYTETLCIAVGADGNPLLRTILNKGIASISDNELQAIISSHRVLAGGGNPLLDYIYADPIRATLIGALLAGLALLFIYAIIFFIRRERKKRNTDRLTGLFNYAAFEREAGARLAQHPEQRYALICINIGNYMLLHNTFGEQFSAQALPYVGMVIKKQLLPGDVA